MNCSRCTASTVTPTNTIQLTTYSNTIINQSRNENLLPYSPLPDVIQFLIQSPHPNVLCGKINLLATIYKKSGTSLGLEVAQLKKLTVLPVDLSLVPRTHVKVFITTYNSSLRSNTFWSLWAPAHTLCT